MNRRGPPEAIGAIVLTGGRSARMGRDKALLTVSGEPLLAHVVAALREICDPIVAVDPRPDRLAAFDLPVVADPPSRGGPLAGFEAGLRALHTELVFLVACDMPGFRAPVLQLLRESLGEADAIVAVVDGRPQPLGALYRRRVLDEIAPLRERLPGAGLRHLLEVLDVEHLAEDHLRRVDPDGTSFLNLNCPEDIPAYEAVLRKHGSGDGTKR